MHPNSIWRRAHIYAIAGVLVRADVDGHVDSTSRFGTRVLKKRSSGEDKSTSGMRQRNVPADGCHATRTRRVRATTRAPNVPRCRNMLP